MPSVFAFRALGVALAAAMAFMPIVPPEHVHDAEEHGHHHLLVHRHSQPHGFTHHADGHTGVLDDDDAPVVTLNAAFTVPPVPAGALAAPSANVHYLAMPPVQRLHVPVGFVERLIHGPPRSPASLRAPPFYLAL